MISDLIKQITAFRLKKNSVPQEAQFDRLYLSILEKLQGPEAIEWFPTYLCNSNCRYCGGYDKEAVSGFGNLVPYNEIIEIIRLSGRSGASVWNVGGRGGEPLLYPDLIGALEEIKRCNMKGILITNGLLLNEPLISRLARSKWDILRISLDSHLAQIHDELRGVKGNFSKIDAALDLFIKIKKQDRGNFPYIICCPVITNKNYQYVKEYMEYCIDKGVNEIQFMPLINVHERAGELMLSEHEKNELADSFKGMIYENRIRHNIAFMQNQGAGSTDHPNNKLYCIHLWKTMVIAEDGYLSPCSLIKDKLSKIGKDYLKCWENKGIKQLRQKVLRGELIHDACKDCCGPLRNETDNFNRYLLKHGLKIK